MPSFALSLEKITDPEEEPKILLVALRLLEQLKIQTPLPSKINMLGLDEYGDG